MNGDEIVLPCDRHSNETVTKETCYQTKTHGKMVVEFLRNFENRCIKIARVNSIRINKSIIYFNSTWCVGGSLWCWNKCLNYQSVRSRQLIEKSMIRYILWYSPVLSLRLPLRETRLCVLDPPQRLGLSLRLDPPLQLALVVVGYSLFWVNSYIFYVLLLY